MQFEAKNKIIELTPVGNIQEKVNFIRNLYDKASEKINHFDKLRQQHLNYALVSFSALLAFVINNKIPQMQFIGCAGIVILMIIFWLVDHRFHKYTHGYWCSMFIFTQVIAYLLNKPEEVVVFFEYHTSGEAEAIWYTSLHTWIYFLLALSAAVLGYLIQRGIV